MDRHSELERKFQAHHVDEEKFKAACMRMRPFGYKSGGGYDVYYRNGENVVRHRHSGGAGELTVKQRKSPDDITDRIEINLGFNEETTLADVEAFLLATGWKEDLRLSKCLNHLFWFKHGEATLAVCLYEVTANDSTCRFIEIEVVSDSNVSDEVARRILDVWCGVMIEELDLARPMTASLYEIYTGKRYVQAQS